jgi:hypothetical protein
VQQDVRYRGHVENEKFIQDVSHEVRRFLVDLLVDKYQTGNVSK